jgi:hypothetical protein
MTAPGISSEGIAVGMRDTDHVSAAPLSAADLSTADMCARHVAATDVPAGRNTPATVWVRCISSTMRTGHVAATATIHVPATTGCANRVSSAMRAGRARATAMSTATARVPPTAVSTAGFSTTSRFSATPSRTAGQRDIGHAQHERGNERETNG